MRRWQVLSSLSPRRRRTVIVASGLLVLLVVAVVVLAVLPSRSHPADQRSLGPVLLVPGYGGQLSSLDDLRARLIRAGRAVQEVPLPDGGVGNISGQAAAIQSVVARDLAAGAPSVDLIGYSAGGVAVRLWAHEDGHADHARRIVTIGSPQHGTSVAGAAGALFGGACTGACAQLEPDSELLDTLNAGDETPNGPEWVSIWTTVDQTVVPANSASLDGALDIPLQSICPRDRVSHSGEPRDPAVIGLVVASLGTGPLPVPSQTGCAALISLGRG